MLSCVDVDRYERNIYGRYYSRRKGRRRKATLSRKTAAGNADSARIFEHFAIEKTGCHPVGPGVVTGWQPLANIAPVTALFTAPRDAPHPPK